MNLKYLAERMLYMKKVLFVILILPSFLCFAQDIKRTNTWYFGVNNGIDFNTSPATHLNNGLVSSYESNASISDTNGNLLFYMDKDKVRNKFHQIIPNGGNIFIDQSCTQGALIVPCPQNDSLYYLFTIIREAGFYYSIININADSGRGSVILSNRKLLTPVSEKLTGVRHANGTDVWIVVHGAYNNNFYGYLLTSKGIVTCPMISSIGTVYNGSHEAGAMKFSNDGKLLAVATFVGNTVELFDFNSTNGNFSNMRILDDVLVPYGVEISPTNRFLYVFEADRRLFQYDLWLQDVSLMKANRYLLYDFTSDPFKNIQGLQLGSDGKIYMAMPFLDSLSVINQPDSFGSQSQFAYKGFSLNGNPSQYGLPNFIASHFNKPKTDFQYSISCPGTQGNFIAITKPSVTSWVWKIKRISNNTVSSYSTKQISHSFSDSGNYSISLIAGGDTVVKNIFVDAPILPSTDTLGCGVDSVLLIIPPSYRCIQWNDTTGLYNKTIKTNGTYTIQGCNAQGCLVVDSINIKFTSRPVQPAITKVTDSLFCTTAFAYQWYLNDSVLLGLNQKSIKPMKAGIYSVLITDSNGCSNMSNGYISNVGIDNVKGMAGIRIYPNPVTTTITIESTTKLSYRLFDLSGREHIRGTLNGGLSTVDIGHLCEGMHLLEVLKENNSNPQKLKLIILGK